MNFSAGQLQPKQMVAALRSKRGMTWIVVATLAIGGGYYFLGENPSPKMLPKLKKPAVAAAVTPKSNATKRDANTTSPKQAAAVASKTKSAPGAKPAARA